MPLSPARLFTWRIFSSFAGAEAMLLVAVQALCRWPWAHYLSCVAVAVGLVPAAVFLVHFVRPGLSEGAAHGAVVGRAWRGTRAGTRWMGILADRIGFGRALLLGLLLSAAGGRYRLIYLITAGALGFALATAAPRALAIRR